MDLRHVILSGFVIALIGRTYFARININVLFVMNCISSIRQS